MLGVNGIQLRLGEVIDNPSPKRVTHNIDRCSHPVPGDEEQNFSEEGALLLLRGQSLEQRHLWLCSVSTFSPWLTCDKLLSIYEP
jgi:hypothetical protein